MSQRMSQLDVDRQNAKVFNARMKEDKPESPFEGKESELHSQVEAELRNRRWYFVHSMPHKATTQKAGVPDYIIAKPNGETLWCELKRKGGKLSPEQTVTRHVLLALGHKYETIFSMTQFLKFINQ